MSEPRRYLCSHLLTVITAGAVARVNLEEIWPEGAVLECEAALEEGAAVDLDCNSVILTGSIKSAERHQFGWRVEIEFSPGAPWSLALFRPEHLFDPASLARRATESP